MKKIKMCFFTLIVSSALLTGCANDNATNLSQNISLEDYNWLPTINNEDEILLYDKFDQRILTYNTKDNKIVSKNETLNYLQYEFNDLTVNIYTTGHSVENNFKILEKDEKEIITLYQMNENEGIFPLAYKDDNNIYFLKTSYNDNGDEIYEERVICRFDKDTKELNEIKSTKGMMISKGTVINDILYFTVYEPNLEYYNLYQMSISKEETPTLLTESLVSGDIYNNNGVLYVSDREKIYNYKDETLYFPKKSLNYFYLDKLFQVYVNKTADLELSITNTNTNELENTISNIIDFYVTNNKINIYTSKEVIQM